MPDSLMRNVFVGATQFPVDCIQNVDDLLLLISTVGGIRTGNALSFVLLMHARLVSFYERALCKVGKELGQKPDSIGAHGEYVILMDAQVELATSDETSAQFVEVTTSVRTTSPD